MQSELFSPGCKERSRVIFRSGRRWGMIRYRASPRGDEPVAGYPPQRSCRAGNRSALPPLAAAHAEDFTRLPRAATKFRQFRGGAGSELTAGSRRAQRVCATTPSAGIKDKAWFNQTNLVGCCGFGHKEAELRRRGKKFSATLTASKASVMT